MGKGAKRGRSGSPSRPARYRGGARPVARPEVEGEVDGAGTVATAVTEPDILPPSPVEPAFSVPSPSPVEVSFPPPPRPNPMPFAPPPPMGTGFDDLEELSFPRTGYPLSTRSLVMALVIALAFGGGIVAQKRHDAGLIRPAAAAAAALAGAAAGGGGGGGAAVVGTITAVSPTEVKVRDAGGVEHKVTVTEGIPVLKKIHPQELTTGSQLAVQGNTDSDGTVHATGMVAP